MLNHEEETRKVGIRSDLMRIKGKRVRREEKEEGYISKILNLFTHLVEKNQPANAEKGSRSEFTQGQWDRDLQSYTGGGIISAA